MNLVIIFIVLCSYRVTKRVLPQSETINATDESEEIKVNVTYEDVLGAGVLDEVREAMMKMPPEVVKAFVKENWKIAVVSEIDLSGTQFEGDDVPLTIGLTDYASKLIQVAPVKDSVDDFIMIKTLHELCHYADHYYNNAADSSEWKDLYAKYKTVYVEYEYEGITGTDRNRFDVAYAVSDRYEFFACSMKDYLKNPEYLKTKYPETFDFFSRLLLTEK